ncbi:MAG: SDR family NAD(P)-dependent oxidoreductase [Candidatus Methylomirabilis sp.]|nr:SDR family NAD(P)-dependent oxidoreductase [Deltaproteobacteria bacterium]
MARNHVLITGGAGFIGSFIADALLERGHFVRVLDNLEPQVHGAGSDWPAYLSKDVERVKGDIRSLDDVSKALKGIDVVFHEAALVGVGQSMYDVRRYVDINELGSATVLQGVLDHRDRIEKVLVASSMSNYGEGLCWSDASGEFAPELRPESQLARREWEILCPKSGKLAQPRPTPETRPLAPSSIYSVSKASTEYQFLAIGRGHNIPTVAFRYFNVYGPRQALSNPYTGVAAIFAGRVLGGDAPLIFEDGLQSRDFVHVSDIVQANLLGMEKSAGDYDVFNVGTGRQISVLEVAELIIEKLGKKGKIAPQVVGKYRAGDIRHCYADISKIRRVLGYEPKVTVEQGYDELIEWVRSQTARNAGEQALGELEKWKLVR